MAEVRDGDLPQIANLFARLFAGLGAFAVVATALAAAASMGVAFGLRILGLTALLALACGVSGWVLGLLFGIPRSLARDTVVVSGADASSTTEEPVSRVNTNLEDISDWLTKTIVGVGLTQLFQIPHFAWTYAGAIDAGGFNWPPHGRLLALAIFFYFAPGGFWLGYVATRTSLTRAFDDVFKSPAKQAELVISYWLSGDRLKARRLLSPSINTMLNALYEDPPTGFKKAIEIGEGLLKAPGQEKNANLHIWLACAYGQQYDWQRQETPDAVHELEAIRQLALREIKAAIAAQPAAKDLLRTFWLASGDASDNDLAAFGRDDPDFAQLLGSFK